MPLVAPTGALVAMKGRSIQDEIAAASGSLATWRCGTPEVKELGTDILHPPTTVVRVSWADPTRIGWPLPRDSQRRTTRRQRRADDRADKREVL